MAGFFDDESAKVEYQRSYLCNTSTTYNFTNVTRQGVNVSIIVANFQVQAFNFREPNITLFGDRMYPHYSNLAFVGELVRDSGTFQEIQIALTLLVALISAISPLSLPATCW